MDRTDFLKKCGLLLKILVWVLKNTSILPKEGKGELASTYLVDKTCLPVK